jgi:uncharacterized delta-60 repeat protein
VKKQIPSNHAVAKQPRDMSRSHSSSIGSALLGLVLLLSTALLTPVCAQVGGRDPSFSIGQVLNGSAAATVHAVAQTSSGLIIAGDFTTVRGISKGRIARLTISGSLDQTFAAGEGANAPIRALVVQSDGKLLVGGEFTTFDGVARNRIARLNSNGTLDTTFNPGSGLNGTVHCLALSSYFTGGVIVGGEFTTANNVSRNRIAKFSTTTGAHDTSFNPGTGVNGPVYAVLPDPSWFYNGIYVGGDFTSFNGSARGRLARVSDSGQLASFNTGTGFDGPVYTLSGEGSSYYSSTTGILVGGDFNAFDGIARSKLARLSVSPWSTSSVLDQFFKVWLDGAVRAISVSSASSSSLRVVIGGDFQIADGASRSRVARLTITGSGFSYPSSGAAASVDAFFDQGLAVNAPVRAIAMVGDTRVFIGGGMTSIGGTAAGPVARLYGDYGSSRPGSPTAFAAQSLSTTQVAVEWAGATNASGYNIETSPNGGATWIQATTATSSPRVVSGLAPGTLHSFRIQSTNYNGSSAFAVPVSATTALVEWSGPGSVDGVPGAPNSTVQAVALQPDGKILIAGSFTSVGGVSRNRVARMNTDMTLDTTFNPGTGPNSTVDDLCLQTNGKILIVGSFSQYAGVDRKYVARLNADGSLDTSFDVGIGPDSSVECIAMLPNGRILVGGWFSTFNGYSQDYVARLNTNGSLDLTFRTTPSSVVYDIDVLPDSRFYIAGGFSTVNGLARSGVARLLSNGEVDTSFSPGSGGTSVYAISRAVSGHVVLGGTFSSFAGSGAKYVARLDSAGAVDTSFAMVDAPNNSVETVAIDGSGRILLGGNFTKLGNQFQFRIARILANGAVDPSFKGGAGASSAVYSIAVQPDSRILLGGAFTTIGASQRNYFARVLGGDTATPLIVTDTMPSAIAGQSYSTSFVGVGGVTPYSWQITSGSAPQGLVLSSSGTLSGIPSEAVASTFVVTLTGADGAKVEKSFSLASVDVPSGLKVIQARYGAGATFVDVTSVIAARVSGASASVSVSNSAFGGDPAPGQTKTLWVTYQNSTGRYVVSAGEGTTLTFPTVTASRTAITFDEWRSTKFSSLQMFRQSVSGATSDPDGDGLSNLLESAFGGDPLAPDAFRIAPFYNIGTASQIRFTCDAYQSDLTYTVQVTGDVTNENAWESLARSVAGGPTQVLRADVSVQDSAVGVRSVTVTHARAPSDSALFYRVRVQGP